MAKKEIEPKVILERTYIIPLRREWLKVPEYKRANKAVKSIKKFLVRHMKIYERDLDKVKVDILLNNEIRFRGMRKPPTKIKVKAKKFDTGEVKVELAEIPQVIKYKIEREKRQKEKTEKMEEKKEEKVEEKKEKEELEKKLEEEKKEEEEEKPEEKKEREEKKEAVREAGLKIAKEEHRKMKHETARQKIKKQPLKRMALQK